MKSIFSVIFMNFWSFDFIIFLAAAFTFYIYFSAKNSAEQLHKKLHLTVYVPDSDYSQHEIAGEIAELRENEVLNMRNHTGKLYSLFVNLTGIFPLLGILGTVISLLHLAGDMSDVTGNFYGALTSTFWGLVFAIIFKFLDGMIAPKIEYNEKSVSLYLERNSAKEHHKAGIL